MWYHLYWNRRACWNRWPWTMLEQTYRILFGLDWRWFWNWNFRTLRCICSLSRSALWPGNVITSYVNVTFLINWLVIRFRSILNSVNSHSYGHETIKPFFQVNEDFIIEIRNIRKERNSNQYVVWKSFKLSKGNC